jgi:tetratricopeptide (TPR) repeat protein
VNKERFNLLLKDYSNLDNQNKDLESLMLKFPYSQPVRMLNVKSSSSLSKKEYQQRIALAAFYTTDRNVLRSLIEKGKVPSDFGVRTVAPPIKKQVRPGIKQVEVVKKKAEVVKKKVAPVKKSPPSKIKAKASVPPITKLKQIDAEQLRKEVLANLELLQQTKAAFLKVAHIDSDPVKKIKITETKNTTAPKKVASKKVTKTVATASTAKSVKASKSPRTKKNELIDKFIADEPSITRGKAVKEKQSDLSKASSELKEDLVSENLAIIYAKQGRANKAIEIYKKLIWKFPQKKASFAARIEELKKK